MSRLENWWIQDVHDGQVAYGNIYDDERYNPTTTEYQDGHLSWWFGAHAARVYCSIVILKMQTLVCKLISVSAF